MYILHAPLSWIFSLPSPWWKPWGKGNIDIDRDIRFYLFMILPLYVIVIRNRVVCNHKCIAKAYSVSPWEGAQDRVSTISDIQKAIVDGLFIVLHQICSWRYIQMYIHATVMSLDKVLYLISLNGKREYQRIHLTAREKTSCRFL